MNIYIQLQAQCRKQRRIRSLHGYDYTICQISLIGVGFVSLYNIAHCVYSLVTAMLYVICTTRIPWYQYTRAHNACHQVRSKEVYCYSIISHAQTYMIVRLSTLFTCQ